MNFNEKLIDLRKSRGLSQEELGAELHVSRQTVSKWESAQSYPDFQRLVLLSDYFGLTLDALVRDVDVQEVNKAKRIFKWWLIGAGTAAGIVLTLLVNFFLHAVFVW